MTLTLQQPRPDSDASRQNHPHPRSQSPSRIAGSARHPYSAEITGPATTEAGDIVWLDERTLLVGQGYRTNKSGIDQLRALLAPHEIEVISAPLPHARIQARASI